MRSMADITHDDLDEILAIENPVTKLPTLSNTDSDIDLNRENIMKSNREPFPSQMSFDYDNESFTISGLTNVDNVDSNINPLPLMTQFNFNTTSIILDSQQIETINLSHSTATTGFHNTHNVHAPNSIETKSEKFDFASNAGDNHDKNTFEDDFPNLSDIDFDEIEELENIRGSCGTKITNLNRVGESSNKFSTEKNKNINPLIISVKEERLDSSLSQSGNEDTFARELNAYEIELPNLDVDFELLDEVERAHTSRQAEVSMQVQSSLTGTENLGAANYSTDSIFNAKNIHPSANRMISPIENATQINAINLTTADIRSSSSVPLSHVSSRSSSANPMDFLSLKYGNLTPQNLNTEQQSSVNFNAVEGINERISSQPLDYSRFGEVPKEPNTISSVIREPIFNIINESGADATMIPLSVKQLYDVIKAEYSDFAFVYALSAQLCQNRVPMDCFVNLKMGLLLSIASIGQNPDIPPIPIVAIGSDSYMTNHLMTNIGQLAERFIGPTYDIKPPSNASDKTHIWIEADPIILAKGGVYYVSDWSILKAARVDKLFKIVECSSVPIEKTTYVYPLETAIWTYWRSYKNNAKEQQIFNNFVKVFGIPIVVDNDNHEVLVDYILQQSSVRVFESTIDHLSISEEDMRSFLAVISKRTADHSAEATSILQKYFVASRIERPDCLSKQAFVVLKQFAESFTKLSFRHEVLEIDAVAAIFMCENYVQNIFGASDNPPPKFESHNYVGNVHAHLKNFKKWLNKYIERYHDKP